MKKQSLKTKRLNEVKRKHLKTVKRKQLSEIKKSIKKFQRLNENERQGNYDRTLEVIKSFEEDKTLQDFLRTFPKGEDISEEDYFKFVFRKGHEPGTDDDYYARLNWKYIVSGDKSVYDDDDNRI
jgi:hypothetical protein